MTDATQNDAAEEPLANADDERQAIRDELPDDIHVLRTLTCYGREEMVELVQRDRAPSTGDPARDETVVLVEWHGLDDYALSLAEGGLNNTVGGWELTEELVSMHDDRADAVDAAAQLFEEDE